MSSESFDKEIREKALNCIKKWLDLDLAEVPVLYVKNFEFYKVIKANYMIEQENYNNIESLKLRFRYLCEIIQGLYKWKEKTIYIKKEFKADLSLLIAELLHAKSITQGHHFIKAWIREGLPHYLAKIVCQECNITYNESGYKIYFPLWEFLLNKYNFDALKTIIYTDNLKVSIKILRYMFNYDKDDILELSYKEAMDLIL